MIRVEHKNGCEYRYSDEGRMLLQIETGVLYDDAMDVSPCPYTYEETDILTDEVRPPAWDILQGQMINAGDEVSSLGVVYVCIKTHTAAWNRQPPNDEYWEVRDNE